MSEFILLRAIMNIIVGIGLDARCPNDRNEQLGEVTVGELGLIQYLEFYAGISSQTIPSATRIITYLNALKSCENGERFYTASLSTDPIATAETLLQWRDWAIFYGWQYEPGSFNDGRLTDLDIVEKSLTGELGSLGERLYLLINRIEIIKHSVKQITLLNTKDEWPELFQKLFANLECEGVKIAVEKEPCCACAAAETDLGKIQRAIIEGNIRPTLLTHDGTINFFRTSNAQLASIYAARLSNKDSLTISANYLHCLAAACSTIETGSIGVGSASYYRAPNQLLLLMLQCAWMTPQPDTLLQYLTLPVGKFKKLRNVIARSFKDKPGHDLVLWQFITDEYVKEVVVEDPECDEKILRDAINSWLPIGICDSDQRMPIIQAVSLCDHVASYWVKILTSDIDKEYAAIVSATHQAANAAALALRDWPDVDITKEQLNRLVGMIMEIGSSRWEVPRMVTDFDIVQSSESANLRNKEIKHLIWIDPRLSVLEAQPPFSKSELECVPLAPNKVRQALIQKMVLDRALSVILSATEAVIFITIDDQPDLLKLQLNVLVGTDDWSSLEDVLLAGKGTTLACEVVSDLCLPEARRFWDVGQSVYTPREIESYSSLEKLALKPHEYTLKYLARFSEGSIRALPADSRLKGNLAHAIVEAWLKENVWTGSEINSMEIEIWLKKRLPDLFHQMALPLLQPGMHVERLEFKKTIFRALYVLFDALFAANVIGVQSELTIQRQEKIGLIESRMDLYCELANGQFVIIDMKWGSYDKHREDLKKGTSLQLATYARTASGVNQDTLADAAFFIIKEAQLLSTHHVIFPTATFISPEQTTTLNQAWQQFENTALWRVEQLKQGQVEVTYGIALPDEDLILPENVLPIVEIEKAEYKKNSGGGYRRSYKRIDAWRNLTRNIKEL